MNATTAHGGLPPDAAHATVFQWLRLPQIVAMTSVPNERSRRVMERLGMTYDPRDDFDHPLLPTGHPLQRNVLYRIEGLAG